MIWEVWVEQDPDGDTFSMADPEAIRWQQHAGLIGPGAVRLHEIEAPSFDDAMRQYHELMGWEPYCPLDD